MGVYDFMLPVKSRLLDEVGYHEGDLYVRYSDGKFFVYEKVPNNLYTGLMMADSEIDYLTNFIDGKYNCKQLNRPL